MGLGFTVIGSGSSGNALLVSGGDRHILVDIGLSGREAARRLREHGLEPERVSGDHCRGVAPFAGDLDIPVFLTDGALEASGMKLAPAKRQRIRSGVPFEVSGMHFTPFAVPHDSVDPIAFSIERDGVKIAVVLDLGYISNLVVERLKGCDGIVLESNHDVDMLRVGPYPWALKQRVMSRRGHLSNDTVAAYLASGFDGRARHVVLAHLSRKNNLPELARGAARRALEGRSYLRNSQTKLELAGADRVGPTCRY
jgi:phosphoribosyl 1,2-cyclic phosphodiesterase